MSSARARATRTPAQLQGSPVQSIKRVHAGQRFPLFRAGFKRVPSPDSLPRSHSFPARLCCWPLRPWQTLGALTRLAFVHVGSSYLFCRRHQYRGRWAPPRPLLRGSFRNPLQSNPATKDTDVCTKVLRSRKGSRRYSSHVPDSLLIPPSPSTRSFLSEGLRVAAGFASLLFPVQPPSLLLSARVSLPPSLPPSPPSPPAPTPSLSTFPLSPSFPIH